MAAGMRIEQRLWNNQSESQLMPGRSPCDDPQRVRVFAAGALLRDAASWQRLRERWPRATLVADSTTGEICGTHVHDDSLVATAVQFDQSRVRTARVDLADCPDGETIGKQLAERLASDELRHVFVLPDGFTSSASVMPLSMSGSARWSSSCVRFRRSLKVRCKWRRPSETWQVISESRGVASGSCMLPRPLFPKESL